MVPVALLLRVRMLYSFKCLAGTCTAGLAVALSLHHRFQFVRPYSVLSTLATELRRVSKLYAAMPTTQELPQLPLEGTGFFQTEPSGVETTVEPPESAGLAPLEGGEAERERGMGRAKRKGRPSIECG